MAYDEDLANRVRQQIAGEEAITEQPMFGGLAFLLGGHMALAVSRNGGLIVRVGADAVDDALDEPHASVVDMGGRRMTGWVAVAPEGVVADAALGSWVERGAAFARSLPPKG